MFFDNLPDMPEDLSDEMIETSNQWLSSMLEDQLWWRETVASKYGMTSAMVSYLLRTRKIPGCIVVGGKTAFIAKFAKPWFDRYVSGEGKGKRGPKGKRAEATNEINVDTPVFAGKRGRGRPRKIAASANPDAWRDFTIDDIEFHIEEMYSNENAFELKRWAGKMNALRFDMFRDGELSQEDFDSWKTSTYPKLINHLNIDIDSGF